MDIRYTKETWSCLYFEYISGLKFLIDLAIPSHARPSPVDLWITSKKTSLYLYSSTYSWGIGI